jgi:8-oxo-dGTP pyrophosphatase MutT (NUDIX family)
MESAGFVAPPALVEHARRFYAAGGPPAPPRVAATVLLLRPAAPTGFEVYVIRRAAAMTFGGMYAFPGGGVDPSDSQPHLDWSGPAPAQWADRLGLSPGPAQAVVCAAAREVFEEAGVLLAGPHPGTVVSARSEPGLRAPQSRTEGDLVSARSEPGLRAPQSRTEGNLVGDVSGDEWESARQALVNRHTGFADLLRERRLTVRSDLLVPWSRWITPEFEPRRFDTYFFVALLPDGQRTRDVSGEADHTMWIRPAAALTQAAAGEIAMLPPTMVTLAEVAACPDLAAVAAAAAGRDVATPVTPRLELPPDGEPRLVLD